MLYVKKRSITSFFNLFAYNSLGDNMDDLFELAEKEMFELKHPYVGTEHFLLAYLKKYKNNYIDYETFKKEVIDVIGFSYKESEYILYTPILRDIKNNCNNIYEAMVKILTDDNCIAYNILLVNEEDIEAIYLNVINTNY